MLLFLIACNDGTLNTKNINATPEASIILPDATGGGEVEGGTEVLFRAVVSDADPDDQDLLEVRWRVDDNPEPACDYAAPNDNGESDCTILIEEGMEKVVVEVKDPQNAIGVDEYILSLYFTEAPVIELLNPQSDGIYQEGVAIEFEALVEDAEDPAEELTVAWNSDLEGDLDIGGTVSPLGFVSTEGMLIEGTHLITATVTDSTGKTGNTTVEIVVGPLSVPTVDFVDIQNTGGVSIDEAFDGQTIVCDAGATDPEGDPLTWTYQWFNAAGTDISTDSSNNLLTLDYATQSLAAGELVTCIATATDGQTSGSDSDTVMLVDCSPFATEIPYDGIDSNCDGLETLNDQDGDGTPDTDEDYDVSDDYSDMHGGSNSGEVPARVGVECMGEAFSSNGGTVYFLLCDNDMYWKGGDAFCQDNGYDSLATFHSEAEMDHAKTLIDDFFRQDGTKLTDAAMIGFTRGPDCSPAPTTNSAYPSVCGGNIGNYYWIDNASASWVTTNHWADTSLTGSVEHCGQLVSNANAYGFWDVYCEYGANNYWSKTHTNSRPVMCMKRQ